MFWGQALIEFPKTNKERSWQNFHAWHLNTDSKSAFATSLVGRRSPPLTTLFGISAFDMSRDTDLPTLPMSSRMHHFPNRRPPDHRIAHTWQRGVKKETTCKDELPKGRRSPLFHLEGSDGHAARGVNALGIDPAIVFGEQRRDHWADVV